MCGLSLATSIAVTRIHNRALAAESQPAMPPWVSIELSAGEIKLLQSYFRLHFSRPQFTSNNVVRLTTEQSDWLTYLHTIPVEHRPQTTRLKTIDRRPGYGCQALCLISSNCCQSNALVGSVNRVKDHEQNGVYRVRYSDWVVTVARTVSRLKKTVPTSTSNHARE